MTKRFLRASVFWLLFGWFALGCATSQQELVFTHEDWQRLGAESASPLLLQVEARSVRIKESEGSEYLTQIGNRLLKKMPSLGLSSLNVSLIRNKTSPWVNFALPHGQLYLSIDLLKRLTLENEVISMLALEIAHLERKSVLQKVRDLYDERNLTYSSGLLAKASSRLSEMRAEMRADMRAKTIDWGEFLQALSVVQMQELFHFSLEEEQAAIKVAVELLYRSGYDSRGLISLYLVYQNQPNYSPYISQKIKDLLSFVRQEIAYYAPLRNPIVGSQRFLFIHKRMQNL